MVEYEANLSLLIFYEVSQIVMFIETGIELFP